MRVSHLHQSAGELRRRGRRRLERRSPPVANTDVICATAKRFFFTARPPGPTARPYRDTRSHFELGNLEFLSLAVLPSRNGDYHTKKKDEEWVHRRLDTEW
jgi:hypothetical protein